MNNDNNADIAYLITYINYSYIINKKGTIKKIKLNNFILDELAEYIINNSSSKKFECVEDIENFWNRYNGYLVWEAYCVENGSWINIKPSNEEILDKILQIIRTNSYVNLEEINMNDFSQILNDHESMSIKTDNCSKSVDESDSKSIDESDYNIIYLEPDWQQIGNYEMANSLETISN